MPDAPIDGQDAPTPGSPPTTPDVPAFAEAALRRLAGVPGLRVVIDRGAASAAPGYVLIDVEWAAGSVLCEMIDGDDGVRVMDDHGEDVSTEEALRYIAARAAGSSRRAAWHYAVHPA